MERVRRGGVDEVKGEKSDESLKSILAKKAEEQRRRRAMEEAAANINANLVEKKGK